MRFYAQLEAYGITRRFINRPNSNCICSNIETTLGNLDNGGILERKNFSN